jgi:ADP-heptose:LPS heptosyltransferase
MRRRKQYFRRIRHDTRVGTSFIFNYICLKRLRQNIKRADPKRKLIAIHLLEHIGDIVASEPISRYIKQQNPGDFILWSVKKPYREIVDTNPHIHKTVIVHCLSERLLLSKSGLFDQVIDLHFHDRYCSLCTKPLRKTNQGNEVHLGNYFTYGSLLSALSRSAGLPISDGPPRVYIPQASVRRVDGLNLPECFIAINCSSNTPIKDWPADKWHELTGKMINDHGMHVVELGISPQVSNSPHSKYFNLCGRLSILESAEVIRRALLFIGIDSGPAHLANAVDTQGIILMGSYLGFDKYNPFSGEYKNGTNSTIVYEQGPVAGISVERVFQAANERLRK